MASFIVVPKVHQGRYTSWEIIDTGASMTSRHRMGFVDDENQARSLADVLNGAEAVYRATLKAADEAGPF